MLKYIPSLKAFKKGKKFLLTTEDSTMDAFFENLERCREDDDICLLKAAKIIRQDLFGSNSLFNGNFDYSSQESSVPKSLLVFLIMILEGTNINSESSYANRPNIFTTAAIGNIDHSSTTSSAQNHFHGTSVSVFQHSTDKSHLQIQNSVPIELDNYSSVPRNSLISILRFDLFQK